MLPDRIDVTYRELDAYYDKLHALAKKYEADGDDETAKMYYVASGSVAGTMLKVQQREDKKHKELMEEDV